MNNPTVRQLAEKEWTHLQTEIETTKIVIESIKGTLAEQEQKLAELEEKDIDLERFLVEYDNKTS